MLGDGLKKTLEHSLCHVSLVSLEFSHLIWSLQLLVLHLPQHVVSCAQCPNFRVAAADKPREADEPQAVAVAQETLRPHLGH